MREGVGFCNTRTGHDPCLEGTISELREKCSAQRSFFAASVGSYHTILCPTAASQVHGQTEVTCSHDVLRRKALYLHILVVALYSFIL